jgi:hypothetical protein
VQIILLTQPSTLHPHGVLWKQTQAASKMSLRDASCYTLTINPTPDPNMVEMVEVSTTSVKGDTRYVRVKESREGEAYSGVVYGESVHTPISHYTRPAPPGAQRWN